MLSHDLDLTRPFTRATALAAGISASALRSHRFQRIFRNVYFDASVRIDQRTRTEAALLLSKETAFASHSSAARLYGVPLPTLPDEHVTATPNDLRLHCAASRLHRAEPARRAAAYVRDRVGSPMETRNRMLLVLAGIPEPELNAEVRKEYGDVVRMIVATLRDIYVDPEGYLALPT